MIGSELLERCRRAFGRTFDVALWARRPGGSVNDLMCGCSKAIHLLCIQHRPKPQMACPKLGFLWVA
jgi:hypothetical protein